MWHQELKTVCQPTNNVVFLQRLTTCYKRQWFLVTPQISAKDISIREYLLSWRVFIYNEWFLTSGVEDNLSRFWSNHFFRSLQLVPKGKDFLWLYKFSVKALSFRGNDLANGCLHLTNDVDILLWNVCCNSILIFWCHYLIHYIQFVNCHHFFYVCFFWLSSYAFHSFTFLLKYAFHIQ